MLTVDDLAAEFSAAVSGIHGDELARLALTAAVDQPLRDRLVSRLRGRFEPQGLRVWQDWWHRWDIAVTQQGRPLLLLNVRAFADFQATIPSGDGGSDFGYGRALAREVGKTHRFLAANRVVDAAVFVILCSTHLPAVVSRDLWSVINCADLHLWQVRRYGDTPAAMHRVGRERVRAFVEVLGNYREVPFPVGAAFGVRCVLDAWVVGPIAAHAAAAAAKS